MAPTPARWFAVPRARIAPRVGPRALALLAAFALLAPSVARVAGPDGPAWFPGHGHIFLTAEAASHPHRHPWDAEAGAAGDRHAPTADAAADVLFTFGDLDVASALAMIALPAFALMVAISWRSLVIHAARATFTATDFQPLVPPPQA